MGHTVSTIKSFHKTTITTTNILQYNYKTDIFLKYNLNSIISKSNTAIIYSSTDKYNINYVIKKISLISVINTSNNINNIINELKIMKELSHLFIVNLYYATYEDMYCYLVMDSLTGGDLRYQIRINSFLSEKSVAYIIACIGSALQYLHSKFIIHRDIKPENIVLDQYCRPILIDFGISYMGNQNELPICNTTSGTLPYVAPEVLTPSHRHSYHSDYWSLGILAYELLYLKLPFSEHCPNPFIFFIANYYEKMWDSISKVKGLNLQLNELEDTTKLTYDEKYTRCLADPHAHISLNSDGSLPEILKFNFPLRNFESEELSYEAKDFLSGLLDPRFPQRLGCNFNQNIYHNTTNRFNDHHFQHHFHNSQSNIISDINSNNYSSNNNSSKNNSSNDDNNNNNNNNNSNNNYSADNLTIENDFFNHPWLTKYSFHNYEALATIESPLISDSSVNFTFGAPLSTKEINRKNRRNNRKNKNGNNCNSCHDDDDDNLENIDGFSLPTTIENQLKDYTYNEEKTTILKKSFDSVSHGTRFNIPHSVITRTLSISNMKKKIEETNRSCGDLEE